MILVTHMMSRLTVCLFLGVYMGWVNPKNPSMILVTTYDVETNSVFVSRCVHGLGQPKKPVKPIQKNLKKWVMLGDWVDMLLKNEKSIKNNGFWV